MKHTTRQRPTSENDVSETTRRSGKKTARKRADAHPARSAELTLPIVEADDGIYLTGEAERAIYNRLSRLEGQVRGVKRMLAERKSCDDMLVQVSALKQAVNGIAAELLQAHMETCVLGRMEAGEGKQALVSLRNALAKVMKHG